MAIALHGFPDALRCVNVRVLNQAGEFLTRIPLSLTTFALSVEEGQETLIQGTADP
jgi:hypothetical protein